ncbi:MAG: 30S ribosomal protein S8 [Planctomycetaceae bacterium]|nr:30S ribosomal protein S8 [Planctomycetaceae bacterium]
MMTDPIADLLTRIRNALGVRSGSCMVPGSRLKVSILDVLKREGYIEGYEVHTSGPKSMLKVALKYGPEGEDVIRKIQRYSKPGCRRYRSIEELPRPLEGLGISVVSTNVGVLSDRECREKNVGGEVLCVVE